MSSTTIQVVLKALDKYTAPLKKISKENAEASEKIRQINRQLKILKGNQHDLKTYSELGKNNQELGALRSQWELTSPYTYWPIPR